MNRHTPRIARRSGRVLALLAVVAALAACGGGGDGDGQTAGGTDPGASGIPASATASVAAFVRYLGGLVADDAREPLSLDGVTLPSSDTEEPASLG